MKKQYNVGIIGFGMIGKVHAFGYQTLPYYVNPLPLCARITHVVTGHKETAERGRQLIGADVASTDFREVTENPAIDIVHCCSPNTEHLAFLLSAIEHGKYIYCEKPLVVNREEAEHVRTALLAKKDNRTNQMTFHFRFFSAIMRAKQLIDSGALGTILQFRLTYLHASSVNPKLPFKWKHGPGGGALLDIGSHALDLVDHLIGPFHSFVADTARFVTERPLAPDSATMQFPKMQNVPVEDSVSLLARLKSGALGTIEASKLATGSEDELRLEIHGDRGAIRFNLMNPHLLGYFDGTTPDRPLGGQSGWLNIHCGGRYESPDTDFPSPKSTIGWPRAHVACLSHFLQAVAQDRPSDPDLMQGYKIQCLMDTVQQSVHKRRWVDVE